MRKLASIQKIKSVEPIDGADHIELVHVLGWQCVANKGQFKEGDWCVYFEIDSFLPIREPFEFLRKSSYKRNDYMGEGFLLKTMKFKGQISQGLVMPIDEVLPALDQHGLFKVGAITSDPAHMEGADVTDVLGVREWEVPEMVTGSGTTIGQASRYIHVTDETRVQSAPELMQEFGHEPYYITTKMDGSSHSICIADDGTFHVFGHNFEYKDDGQSAFYEFVKANDMEVKLRAWMHEFGADSITVQGEWCGGGIQKNRMQLKKPNWFVFTVDINGERQDWDMIDTVTKAIGATTVPLEETGEDFLSTYPTEESLLARAGENRCNAYPGQCEGIVIRPQVVRYSTILGGRPLSMKVINNKYLLKK